MQVHNRIIVLLAVANLGNNLSILIVLVSYTQCFSEEGTVTQGVFKQGLNVNSE